MKNKSFDRNEHTNALIHTINEDCVAWERMQNDDKMFYSYLHLQENNSSQVSGLYSLILNGNELWLGTLEEINAIVKTMIIRLKTNDFMDD